MTSDEAKIPSASFCSAENLRRLVTYVGIFGVDSLSDHKSQFLFWYVYPRDEPLKVARDETFLEQQSVITAMR